MLSLLKMRYDFLNPMLVKEVRQSMRGRLFALSFWSIVFIACVVSFINLGRVEASGGVEGVTSFFASNSGEQLFGSLFSCLAAAVIGIVPFLSFFFMGLEWEENTMDLLELSNLRPRRIIFGKILSSSVLSLMFFCAFSPFLGVGFLLGGVDVFAATLSIVTLAFYSICTSAFAICLATLVRGRIWRYVLAFLLAIGLLYNVVMSALGGVWIVRQSSQLLRMEFWEMYGCIAAATLAFTFFMFLCGCARLAHSQENKSTPMRIYCIVLYLVWAVISERLFATYTSPDVLLASSAWALIITYFMAMFFTTEPELLGRRARQTVPQNKNVAALIAVFLPGGGRGVLHFLFLIGAVIVGTGAIFEMHTPRYTTTGVERVVEPVAGLAMFLFIVLCLPGVFLSMFTKRLASRRILRIVLLLILVSVFTLPMLFGVLISNHSLMRMQHIGNPAYLMERLANENDPDSGLILAGLAICTFITLIANSPRISAGIIEVVELAGARRAAQLAKVNINKNAEPPADGGAPAQS